MRQRFKLPMNCEFPCKEEFLFFERLAQIQEQIGAHRGIPMPKFPSTTARRAIRTMLDTYKGAEFHYRRKADDDGRFNSFQWFIPTEKIGAVDYGYFFRLTCLRRQAGPVPDFMVIDIVQTSAPGTRCAWEHQEEDTPNAEEIL